MLAKKKPSKKIRVYSTPNCPWCHVLKQFLNDNDIEFEDIDVSKDREVAMEMIEKSGQRGVPVIEIDSEMIVGFDKEKISKKLGLK